jgi:hypothetical protein
MIPPWDALKELGAAQLKSVMWTIWECSGGDLGI